MVVVWNDYWPNIGRTPIVVQLMRNGEVCGESITLSDANNWTFTLDGLPMVDQGVLIEYTWAIDSDRLPTEYGYETITSGTITTVIIDLSGEWDFMMSKGIG